MGQGKGGGGRGRGRAGGRRGAALPIPENGLSEAAPNGAADGHADKGREARRRPRRLVEQPPRDETAVATADVANEGLSLSAEAAKDAHPKDDEPEARRKGAVLVRGGLARNAGMGGEAGAVGVLAVDVRRPSRVTSLYVDDDVRLRPVKSDQNNIRTVPEGGSLGSHELVKSTPAAAAATLGKDAVPTESCIKDGHQSDHAWVVAGAWRADAIGALNEVALAGKDGGARVAPRADGDAADTVRRREEEEVNGKGDRERTRLRHSKEGAVLSRDWLSLG